MSAHGSDPPASSRPPASGRSKRQDRHSVFLISGILLFTVLLILPPPSGLNPTGWHTLAVAILMAYWWISEAIPLAVTALLPLVLFPSLGILSSRATAQNYGDHLVFLFLGGFMIAIAMERWNLHRRIALGLVQRVGTRPDRLVLGFLLAAAFLSAWISNTATTVMLLPIAMAVVRTLAENERASGAGEDDAPLEEKLGGALMLALAYGAGVGGLATLVGTPPNIVLVGQVKTLFPELPEISFGSWMLLGVPVSIAMLAAAYFVLMRFGPQRHLASEESQAAGREVLRQEQQKLGPMVLGERLVLSCFLLAAILWITRKPLPLGAFTVPGWSQLFPHSDYLQDTTVAIGVGILLTALRAYREQDGRRVALLDWESIRTRSPWGILILFGGGFALARGFADSGLASWIGGGLHGLKGLPLPLIIALISILAMALTEVTSNTATAILLMPILAEVARSIGAPPLLLMVPAALASSLAFMLPVATPPNAIVFGSGWISIRQMARLGLILDFLGLIVVTLMCWWLAPLVLGPGAH